MELFRNIDRNILLFLYNLVSDNVILETIASTLAVTTIYILPIYFIWLWFRRVEQSLEEKNILVQAILGGLVAWQVISRLVKTFYFRSRPFENTAIDVKELLVHRPDQSFPSDHASLLFGITFSLFLLGKKRSGYIFLVISIVVSIARIATGLHYLSDIIGGIFVGLVGALLVYWLREPVRKYFSQPIVNFAKYLRLAK